MQNSEITFGKKLQPDSTIYHGYLKNEKPHGFGKSKYLDGVQYIGQYKNGEPNGKGYWIYPDGASQTQPKIYHKPLTKTDPEFDNVGNYTNDWFCDICSKDGIISEPNWRNKEDEFDYCDDCFKKAYNENTVPQNISIS